MGEKRQQREKKKPQTKVIIRQLPPTMTEEEFLKQIDPLPEHDDYYFVQADWSLGFEATCRAYINFTNPDDVFLFQERFDGYVFVDSKGTEYPAQVEYAPFQNFSKSRSKKKDIKANSIEADVHYLEFVERFNNDEFEKADLKADFNLNAKSTADSSKLTPLLEYLQDKKDARREERKRRNDERKDRRDRDRQQKKILVAKNIPAAIKEEGAGPSSDQKTDLKDVASRNFQEDKPKEGNGRRDRYEEKRIQRKREKDARRRERRDQKRAEERRGSRESVESGVTKKVEELSLDEAAGGELSEEPKEKSEEVKKTVEQADKKEFKEERRSERRERDRREEKERRIRNKDRPDMQIYQPGKLRINSTSSNPDESGSSAAPTTSVKKRVSRYSEKRRAKESSAASKEQEQETPPDNL